MPAGSGVFGEQPDSSEGAAFSDQPRFVAVLQPFPREGFSHQPRSAEAVSVSRQADAAETGSGVAAETSVSDTWAAMAARKASPY